MTARHTGPAGLGGSIQQLGLVIAAEARQMGRHLLRAQFANQPAVFVQQATLAAEQQQLVRLQVDGRAHGHVFAGEVENLPGGRIAQRRQQHDAALVQQATNALAVDPAHFAGVVIVDAFQHANRPRGDEVATGHPQARALHRRGRHVHGQARLDGDAHLADGVDHAFQGRAVGNPQVAVKVRGQAAGRQAGFDLRARAVHQHQAHAEAVQQHQVVDDIAEVGIGHAFTGQHHHKGAVAVGVDIGGRVTEPVNVVVHEQMSLCCTARKREFAAPVPSSGRSKRSRRYRRSWGCSTLKLLDTDK